MLTVWREKSGILGFKIRAMHNRRTPRRKTKKARNIRRNKNDFMNENGMCSFRQGVSGAILFLWQRVFLLFGDFHGVLTFVNENEEIMFLTSRRREFHILLMEIIFLLMVIPCLLHIILFTGLFVYFHLF